METTDKDDKLISTKAWDEDGKQTYPQSAAKSIILATSPTPP
ncbi:MAG: hypothetical protein OSA95_05460 [Opitutales bacterium]|nr:hypothetical protein [Opitutales bacterium]